MFTLTSLFLGVLAYVLTEVFSWINKKAVGTPFQGKAAWLVVAIACVVIGLIKEFFFSGVTVATWAGFLTDVGTAFVWSQALFTTAQVFLGKLLQVQPNETA
jgi:hypothetical protein